MVDWTTSRIICADSEETVYVWDLESGAFKYSKPNIAACIAFDAASDTVLGFRLRLGFTCLQEP
jgi:hypothetical protein